MNVYIHVGLHKTGTTLLQKKVFPKLTDHILFPWGYQSHRAVTEFVTIEPLSFDAQALRDEFDFETIKHPGMLFSHEALSSRPHHGRFYAPYVAERFKQVFPDAKIILTVREQQGLIYSLYVEHVRNGGMHTLREFIGTGNEPAGWAALCDLNFFQFDRLATMYRETFGEDNVLTLPYELISHDPRHFFDTLFAFLNVPIVELELSKRVNSGWQPLTVELYRRTNPVFRKDPLSPNVSFAGRARRKVLSKADQFIPKSLSENMMAKQKAIIKERVAQTFNASNKSLSEIVGFDLAKLGYQCDVKSDGV
ncbi:MAG: sulfotransferase [Pseudomonadota bacterium]